MTILLLVCSAILLLVIVPIVVGLLQRVLGPAQEIERATQGLAALGESIVSLLGAVDDLPETRRLVGQTGSEVSRYGAALDKVL
ncbi:MAG: hypothetical protein WKF31_07880 [Thermoleophilaceae bacterium]